MTELARVDYAMQTIDDPTHYHVTLDRLSNRAQLVRDAMRTVMRKGVHYGVISGCPQPSLWQPGADLLLPLFGIAVEHQIVDERRTDDEYAVCVRATARKLPTGEVLGVHLAWCSSAEERHAWRKATSQEEFDATPEDKRRIRYRSYRGKPYKELQIRTNVADRMHVVLMIAQKRAKVAVVREVTGAGEIFTQDEEFIQADSGDAATADDTAPVEAAQPQRQNSRPKRSKPETAEANGSEQPAPAQQPAEPQAEVPADIPTATIAQIADAPVESEWAVVAKIVSAEQRMTRPTGRTPPRPFTVMTLQDDTGVLTGYIWLPIEEWQRPGAWCKAVVRVKANKDARAFHFHRVVAATAEDVG